MKILFTSLLMLTILSCKNPKESEDFNKKSGTQETTAEYSGKKLMETHCYLCHSPNAPEGEGRIAPPMIAIKARYIDEETTRAEFVASIKECESDIYIYDRVF